MKHGAKDGKSNMFGIGLTVIFHVALLFIGIGSGLKYNYPPPEEQAILMEFISDEQPSRLKWQPALNQGLLFPVLTKR